MRGVQSGWEQVHAFEREERRRRWKPHQSLVRFCAYLGTGAGELAQIIDADRQVVIGVGSGREGLTHLETDRVSNWLLATWWRHLWRVGNADAASIPSIRSAAIASWQLPWVPCDWNRDVRVALQESDNDGAETLMILMSYRDIQRARTAHHTRS